VQQRRTPGRPGTPRSRATPARTTTPARGGGPSRAGGLPRAAGQLRAAPDPARSAAHPASARRVAAAGAAQRTRAPQPNRFTGRATVLGLVLGALLLAYAYPVRIYLNQQAEIASLQASQTAQRQRIQNLSDESARWNDPAYITAQARSRLLMVPPGDVTYVIIDSDSQATTGTSATAGHTKNPGPWYGELWSSLQAANRNR
jgi:cell division protein FtsB